MSSDRFLPKSSFLTLSMGAQGLFKLFCPWILFPCVSKTLAFLKSSPTCHNSSFPLFLQKSAPKRVHQHKSHTFEINQKRWIRTDSLSLAGKMWEEEKSYRSCQDCYCVKIQCVFMCVCTEYILKHHWEESVCVCTEYIASQKRFL